MGDRLRRKRLSKDLKEVREKPRGSVVESDPAEGTERARSLR